MDLKKETIDRIFEESENSHEVVNKLYEAVYPNWDKVKKVLGFPKISEKTSLYIFDKFMEYEQKHKEGVFPGFLWMNKGFGQDRKLKDWTVKPAKVELMV